MGNQTQDSVSPTAYNQANHPCLRTLLWDVDLDKFDFEGHANFLVKRVLERGTWEEWKWVRKYYGDPRIEKEIDQMKSLDPKALAFCANLFKRTAESFPCYKNKFSTDRHWSC